MQKIDGFPPLAPSVCFVCSQAKEQPHVDTLIDFDPGMINVRNGRMYVCEDCVRTFASALGVTDEATAPLHDEIAALNADADALQAELAELRVVKAVIDRAVAEKKAPAKKTPVKNAPAKASE